MAEVNMPPEEATRVARQLLAAAEELGYAANVVQTDSDGLFGLAFVAPDDVVALAMRNLALSEEPEVAEEPELEAEPEPEVEEKPKRRPGRPRKTAPAEEVTDGE